MKYEKILLNCSISHNHAIDVNDVIFTFLLGMIFVIFIIFVIFSPFVSQWGINVVKHFEINEFSTNKASNSLFSSCLINLFKISCNHT